MNTQQPRTVSLTAVARLGLVLVLLATMLADAHVPSVAASPAAQAAPTATTNAATGVGTSGATLNGTVNAGGSDTTVTFEYGLETSYGKTLVADPNPVIGATDTAVSVTVSDLLPNTTYHFRVVAVNEYGTTYGGDMSFTTLDFAVPAAVTNAASNVTTSGADLNGTVNANGDTAAVFFEYGLDAGYGITLTASPSLVGGTNDTAVSQALKGLLPNTTYHYRVVARNANHTTYGADQAFTTQSSVSSANTGTATNVNAHSAVLNGVVNAAGAGQVVFFEYGLTPSYERIVEAGQSPVAGTSDISVSAAISGLIPNTTYYYRVVAQSTVSTLYGANRSLTTVPSAPTATTSEASSVTTTGATFNGMVNAQGAQTTVTFQYGLDTMYGTTVTAAQSPVSGVINTAVSRSLGGLLPNTTYHYRVVTQNTNGTTYGSDRTFYTGDPATVTATTLAALNVMATGATLQGLVNANGNDATVFFEYGLDATFGRRVEVQQSLVTGTADITVSAVLANLLSHTTYHYRVVAQNAYGITYGADITFTTYTPSPTAITGDASGVTTTAATLNGIVNANNADTAVTFEYGLEATYGITLTAVPSLVSGLADVAVSRTITGLLPNTTYHCRVVAQNTSGTTYGADKIFYTGDPAAVTATTLVALDVTATGATLQGLVNANGNNATAFFEYGLDTAYGRRVEMQQGLVTGTANITVSTMLANLLSYTTYHYRVVAQNAYGSYYGTDMAFTTGTFPAAATNAASGVLAITATLRGTVNANGNDATVFFEYGLDANYSAAIAATPSVVSGITDTVASRTIASLLPNTTYHYRVVAHNVNGTARGADMTFTTGALPTAVTNAASNVHTTTVTLNGTVDARRNDTTAFFEYGLDTSYGTTIAAQPGTISGTADVTVSRTIASLMPNTTYHYRMAAQNVNGTSYGADMTFTTDALATVTTNAASNVQTTTATLNGIVNANGNNTTVFFEYGLDIRYGAAIAAEPGTVSGTTDTAVSRTIASLSPNTTYHYRVVAQNVNGTSYGADMTFTAGALAAVTTNAASNVLATAAILNGTVNANRSSTTALFEYGLDTSYGLTATAEPGIISGTANTAVSRTVASLQPNTIYHYRLVAQNIYGISYGDDLTFSTPYVRVYLPLVLRGYASGPDLVVQRLDASTRGVQVIIANIGNVPVVDEFWVEGYINPRTAPTHVNQIWPDLADQGLVWGVTTSLGPGGVLTLTVGDAYYVADYSQVTWPLAAGTPVYVQVDSANAGTTYGAVLEIHEITGGAYNNITSTISTASTAQAVQAASVVEADRLSQTRLPPRR